MLAIHRVRSFQLTVLLVYVIKTYIFNCNFHECFRYLFKKIFSVFQNALRFVGRSDESTPADVLINKIWRDIARKKCEKNPFRNSYKKILIQYCLFN